MKSTLKIALAMLLITSMSCKKDDKTPEETTPSPTVETGALQIEFENVVDTLPLKFGTNYVNPKGDTFQVTKFNYYISNIVLTANDNSTFTESESYHLIEASNPASSILKLTNLPLASYKSIRFTLGVDSARNVSGAQSGDLAPSKDMFWTWSSGYIFFKFEGVSIKAGSAQKTLQYHIGGYSGVNKTQRNFDLSFGNVTANVSASAIPLVHLSVDVNQLFKSPTLIDFSSQNNQTTAGAGAKVFADNYADMITFEHVHNY